MDWGDGWVRSVLCGCYCLVIYCSVVMFCLVFVCIHVKDSLENKMIHLRDYPSNNYRKIVEIHSFIEISFVLFMHILYEIMTAGSGVQKVTSGH